MRHQLVFAWGLGMALGLGACDCGGGGTPATPDGGADGDAGPAMDAPPADAPATDGSPDGTAPTSCAEDADCDDGAYCNGAELCLPADARADARGCVPAEAPVDCDDGAVCTLDSCSEEMRTCRHTPPDLDGDGHGDVACLDAMGEPVGDDCDDGDARTFPGNMEVCDGHDEDCNPDTFGFVDADADGVASIACCNGAICGGDCDDGNASIRPGASDGPPSACDDVDNDCDGTRDEGCPCVEGLSRECGSAVELMRVGICRPGSQFCVGGAWTETCTGAVHPEEERCDGLDNDCDAEADEFVMRTYYRDGDGDGFGTSSEPTAACSAPMGYVPLSTDCDDMDPGANPGAPEVCNGRDDNCDGMVDEGLLEAFYPDMDGDGYGVTATPTMRCSRPAGHSADPGDCNDAMGAVHPGAREVCNGRDDDCDGTSDPGCACSDGMTQPCGSTDTGECARGTQRCIDGAWAECIGNVEPAPEACNGRDDDCDGASDEMVQTTFYADGDGDGFGNPAMMIAACSMPAGHVVLGTDCNDMAASVNPAALELCDGVDNDCDGTPDPGCRCTDGATRACGTSSTGACRMGTQRCLSGEWAECVGSIDAGPESCNGADDDCDGMIDDGVRLTFYRDVDGDGFGNAMTTMQACSAPTGWVTLSTDCNDGAASVNPAATERCDGMDNDCDATVDPGCACTDGATQACGTTDTGECARGTQRCTGGAWATCAGNVEPTAEDCNGRDDDCDGMVDDGVLLTFYRDADGDGFGTPATTMTACSQPAGYSTLSTDCADTDGARNPAQSERCNGVDDNCDGMIDTGCACTSGATRGCGTSDVGECALGTQRCIDGIWAECVGDVGPTTETCNGLDDDCDMMVDDGALRVFYRDADGDGYGTSTMTMMACAPPPGHVVLGTDCNDADATVNPATFERCNGVDDNCDMAVDTGCTCTDGMTRACGTTDVGECTRGLQTCIAGTWAGCTGNIEPRTETCNALDDDCDGMTDETLTASPCYTDADSDGYGTGTAGAQCRDASRMSFGFCPPGYTNVAGDCNDANGTIRPAGTETCNGTDDDCDGMVDDGVRTTYYRDADGDGYGVTATTMTGCSAPSGYVAASGDCNDTDAAINPLAFERCDGVNNDCDGMTDEGCTCTPDGSTRACGTSSVGVCRMGTQQCVGGVWGTCVGNVDPGTESCNGLDDDCDSMTDEMQTVTCYADADSDGYGAGASVQRCPDATRGMFGNCPAGFTDTNTDCNDSNAAIRPLATETCNAADDDCDGMTDEGVLMTFYRDADRDGFGAVATTMMACTMPSGYVTSSTDCNDGNGAISPAAAERCEGAVDDDCDGTVDDGCACTDGMTRSCGATDVGECAFGSQVCVAGTWASCAGSIGPVTETCNGRDDDCDASTDEMLTLACYQDRDTDTYGFGTSVPICPGAGGFGGCPSGYSSRAMDCNDGNASVSPGATETCNGVDDNCTMGADEGLRVTCYADGDGDGYGTGSTSSQCPDATRMAFGNCPVGYTNVAGDCNDSASGVRPGLAESCNGVDDNCDGTRDNGAGMICVLGATRSGTGAYGTCASVAGIYTCNAGCTSETFTPTVPSETCNAADDNCNGVADDGFACVRSSSGNPCTTACGTSGTRSCTTSCDFTGQTCRAAAETCNNCDDDVNGSVDDGPGMVCPRDTVMPCTTACGTGGIRVCASDCSAYSMCRAMVETCNDCDDDRDGVIDEGFTCEPGTMQTCTTACATVGVRTCGMACGWGVCNATTETCNGCDDNGNGMTDEGVDVACYPDSDDDGFAPAGAPMVRYCPVAGREMVGGCPLYFTDVAPILTMPNTTRDCADADGMRYPGAPEACNGIDDDCDTTVDDGASAACSAANGTTACLGGSCVLTGCNPGYGDCDETGSTGCETNLLTSETDCSSCTASCGVASMCASGVCGGTIVEVVAGGDHACARLSTGRVVCWGRNTNGQCGDGTIGTSTTFPVEVSGITDAVELAVGSGHSCARRATGAIACWGENTSGQLGDGTNTQRLTPVAVSGITTATDITAGRDHTCARLSSGVVQCWGENFWSQLGDGTNSDRNVPTAVSGISTAVEVEAGAGGDHTCARLSDLTVRCWGKGGDGQCGNNMLTVANMTPVTVSGLGGVGTLASVVDLDLGSNHSCARRSVNPYIVCWGANEPGQLGDNLPDGHTDCNGGAAGWPDCSPVPVAMLGNLSTDDSLAAGGNHTCVRRAAGTVLCWGGNASGQLGEGTTSDHYAPTAPVFNLSDVAAPPPPSVTAGVGFTCALRSIGDVTCWGNDAYSQLGDAQTANQSEPVRAWGIRDPVEVSGGGFHTCVHMANGRVRCTGANSVGQLGNGTMSGSYTLVGVSALADAVQIDLGWDHSCARRSGGGVSCWGEGSAGQLGNAMMVDSTTPVSVSGLADAAQISIGGAGGFGTAGFSCARRVGGTASCWGANPDGQLGNGTTMASSSPVAVSGLTGAVDISAGGRHVCARRSDGATLCWGDNNFGQLGDGMSPTDRTTPFAVPGLSDAIQVSAGGEHSCAIRADGQAVCWGRNNNGQIGDRTATMRGAPTNVFGLDDAVSIQAGWLSTCAVRASGLVWCWGDNQYGQLGDGTRTDRLQPVAVTGLGPVLSLRVGAFHACARTIDGRVSCWGGNQNGELGDGLMTHGIDCDPVVFGSQDCSPTPVAMREP